MMNMGQTMARKKKPLHNYRDSNNLDLLRRSNTMRSKIKLSNLRKVMRTGRNQGSKSKNPKRFTPYQEWSNQDVRV
jgi:hypothetical protein